MSRFFSKKFASLTPYTPGEQPRDMQYIKLNTNELPFPPSEKALQYAQENTRSLNLYSDPDCDDLRSALAEMYHVEPEEVIVTNGSDEILNFAFMAFCDAEHPAAFPNISYGFYPVFAELNGVPFVELPLCDDFTIDVDAYCGIDKTIIIANPNAPTGLTISLSDVERILISNPNNVVIIDEAYVDFGGESCLPLVHKYDNLLITRTFSKSRAMAGARLGFGIGNKALIQDLNSIRYSTNPYNVNSYTLALGVGTLLDEAYTQRNCQIIAENRAYTSAALCEMGFDVLNSSANFIFAKSTRISGAELYIRLKEAGVLVRHFSKPEICEYNRITIGTREQMDIFLSKVKTILEDCR